MIRQSSFLSAGFFLFIFVFFWPFSINGGNEKIVQKGNLPPPSIQTPVEGAQYGEKTLEFKWARVEGASRYRLQVAEDNDFISLQDDRNDIRGEAYIFYNFGSKPYYFRMSSIDDHGFEGEWSGTVRFIIKSLSP